METLKASLQVNHNWNQLITQTAAIMRKLPLLFINRNPAEDEVPLMLSRKYKKVAFYDQILWNDKWFKEMAKIGKHVEELKLYDCLFPASTFTDLLICFPALKDLTAHWCTTEERPEDRTIAMMNQLITIDLEGEAWMLADISCKLLNLYVSRLFFHDQPVLVAFLNQQASLKKLDLDYIHNLFRSLRPNDDLLFNPQFQLRSLTLNYLPMADEDHVKRLLEHAINCERVTLGVDLPSMVPRFVLKSFRRLDYLYIDFELLPQTLSFYRALKKDMSLKYLRIDGDFTSLLSLSMLLGHFSYIESLDITDLTGLNITNKKLWSSMSQLLPRLKCIHIGNCSVYNMILMKFPLLKACTIDLLKHSTASSWEKFGRNNPNIETLVIHGMFNKRWFFQRHVLNSLKNLRRFWFNTTNH